MAYELDNNVGTAAIRELFHSVPQALFILLEIPGLRSQALCELETGWNTVNGDQVLGPVFQCTDEGTYAHGSTSKQKHGTVLDSLRFQTVECIPGSEIAGREYICHQYQLFLIDRSWRVAQC
jgi:hypothetical protein